MNIKSLKQIVIIIVFTMLLILTGCNQESTKHKTNTTEVIIYTAPTTTAELPPNVKFELHHPKIELRSNLKIGKNQLNQFNPLWLIKDIYDTQDEYHELKYGYSKLVLSEDQKSGTIKYSVVDTDVNRTFEIATVEIVEDNVDLSKYVEYDKENDRYIWEKNKKTQYSFNDYDITQVNFHPIDVYNGPVYLKEEDPLYPNLILLRKNEHYIGGLYFFKQYDPIVYLPMPSEVSPRFSLEEKVDALLNMLQEKLHSSNGKVNIDVLETKDISNPNDQWDMSFSIKLRFYIEGMECFMNAICE